MVRHADQRDSIPNRPIVCGLGRDGAIARLDRDETVIEDIDLDVFFHGIVTSTGTWKHFILAQYRLVSKQISVGAYVRVGHRIKL